MIDLDKPLVLRNTVTKNVHHRDVKLLASLPNGDLVVTMDTMLNGRYLVFDSAGRYLRADRDTFAGSALELLNASEVVTRYVRVSSLFPDEPSLHPTRPGGDAVASIKVTITDGIMTAAELDRPNHASQPFELGLVS